MYFGGDKFKFFIISMNFSFVCVKRGLKFFSSSTDVTVRPVT